MVDGQPHIEETLEVSLTLHSRPHRGQQAVVLCSEPTQRIHFGLHFYTLQTEFKREGGGV